MDFIKVILTSLLSVAAIFAITKLMGHKQIAQLDFFDYVSGITIGSVAAELATELEAPHRPLVALVVYGLASITLGMLTHNFPRTRKYINGTPTIIMDKGKIYRNNMKQAKLDLSEFLLLCREQGYFDLKEIQTAVFEHNGKLSVLPKSSNRPATPSDFNISAPVANIGAELVMDGRILGENLTRIGRDGVWLEKKLREAGTSDVKRIFLAVYRADGDRLDVYLTE